jgi:L-ascorbate metabolism protein UlaG (beta-lactamase superfamily)
MPDILSFRWLGVAGIEINLNGTVLVIDPLFSRPPLHNLLSGRVTPNPYQVKSKAIKYEAILVTHAHYDHLMDVPVIAKQCGAQVYGSQNACQLSTLWGLPPEQVHELHPGTTIQISSIKVTVIPGSHMSLPGLYNGKIKPGLKPPLHLRDYRMDRCFSYLIDTGSTRILAWSGTNTTQMVEADLIFAGWDSESYITEMLELYKPPVFVPIHWDHFFQPLDKPIKAIPLPPTWLSPDLQRKNPLSIAHRLQKNYPSLRVFIPVRFKQIDVHDLLKRA